VSRWAAGSAKAVRWAAVWTAAVMAKSLGREFQLGQVNLLILLLMVVMVREGAAGRPFASGMSGGASLLFKPYAGVFLPELILKRKWTTLAAGAAALGIGLIVPAAVYGFAGNAAVLGEWKNTLFASTPGLLLTGDNASLWAFAAKAFGFSSTAGPLIIGGLVAAVLGVLYLEMVRRGRAAAVPGSEFTEAAALMMLIPMVSPLGWNYNYLPAVGPAALPAGREGGPHRRFRPHRRNAAGDPGKDGLPVLHGKRPDPALFSSSLRDAVRRPAAPASVKRIKKRGRGFPRISSTRGLAS